MAKVAYKENELYIENVSALKIAKQVGTPVYIYSKAMFSERLTAYLEALKKWGAQHKACYAVKANSNLRLLQHAAALGAGFDIVSVGELERVLIAGGDPSTVVFSGVGKLPDELKRALDVEIACFNVESEAELHQLQTIAAESGKVANISFRVNPDINAETHPYISTGLKENKFGINIKEAEALYLQAAGLSHINVTGVDCHIGSQIVTLQPFLDAMDRVLGLVDRLAKQGIGLSHLNMGGGLGVPYEGQTIPSIETYIDALCSKLANRSLGLLVEPGRSLIAEAGFLLTKVVLQKRNGEKQFTIVDAGMNDLIRPALYSAHHAIKPVVLKKESTVLSDIVGPVCETADCFAKGLELCVTAGDYLCMMNAGAYGMSMASNYNSRPRAAEVFVDGSEWSVIRKRETIDEMLSMEKKYSLGG